MMVEEYLETGDPRFTDELRSIHDADRLGSFGVSWFKDKRPAARRFLLHYLQMPLCTFRHEPLVKRVFKAADAANDDEVMGHFLSALDRTIRRTKRTRYHYEWSTRESWTEETVGVPFNTSMPKDKRHWAWHPANEASCNDHLRDKTPAPFLFTVATRKYLRRRAWRYFRKLGQTDPQRYVTAVSKALQLYRDADCLDGLALIDNWALIHVMFHESDVLTYSPDHWRLVDGQSLGKLKPAPAFPDAWKAAAEPLLDLVGSAGCRPVRQWAMFLLKEQHSAAIAGLALTTLQEWARSDDESLADFAIDALQDSPDIGSLTVQEWLSLIDNANSHVLGRVVELMRKHLLPSRLNVNEIVSLANSRTVTVAKLGLEWLEAVPVESSDDCLALLAVSDAEADIVRAELVDLVRRRIQASPFYESTWVMELLDSRRDDVREVGWSWLNEDARAAQDITNWQRLMETPYDDIQLRLVKLLEKEASSPDQKPTVARKELDEQLLRRMWASVLLNVHRGGRQKPGVVAEIIGRLRRHPDESGELLPLLGVALRSVRTVEWRSALSGLVQLAETDPGMAVVIQEAFPELSIA